MQAYKLGYASADVVPSFVHFLNNNGAFDALDRAVDNLSRELQAEEKAADDGDEPDASRRDATVQELHARGARGGDVARLRRRLASLVHVALGPHRTLSSRISLIGHIAPPRRALLLVRIVIAAQLLIRLRHIVHLPRRPIRLVTTPT